MTLIRACFQANQELVITKRKQDCRNSDEDNQDSRNSAEDKQDSRNSAEDSFLFITWFMFLLQNTNLV